MDRKENFPDVFYPNLIYAILRQTAVDYFDPRFREECEEYLQSEFAIWMSGGASLKILEMCRKGIKPEKNMNVDDRREFL